MFQIVSLILIGNFFKEGLIVPICLYVFLSVYLYVRLIMIDLHQILNYDWLVV